MNQTDISNLLAGDGWRAPIFKVLAHNDTGAAPGHQAGFLIPKALRSFMPELSGRVTADNPTVDKRIQADLFLEDRFVGTVNTRYQFQTWAATRREESRITDELGPIHKQATEGDVLLIQNSLYGDRCRLTLVRKTSAFHGPLLHLASGRSWGELFT